jgi:CxxC motif-containing protein (DUF1111 family)
MPTMLTRIKISDFEEWKAMFDSDVPQAREHATGWRVLRGVEDPDEVIVQVEFPSAELALDARRRLLGSGVLARVREVVSPPVLVEEADAVTR